jgi:hypothetical protein
LFSLLLTLFLFLLLLLLLLLTPNMQSALNDGHGGSAFAGFLSLHDGGLRGPIWH